MVNATVNSWADRSVFVSGHTGFKGSWLALWLKHSGAHVHGYALDPEATGLFHSARIDELLASDVRANLSDLSMLTRALRDAQPQVVFHLAAQSLVRESYRDPLGTLATNVIGTANLLEAARNVSSVRAIVIVTTDKVYENREWTYPYRETDPLGGHDIYSASKAAAELVTASYRASFYSGENAHSASIATARAGNVIGGGDWAVDRLVPDCLRAFAAGAPVRLRFPNAIRPWQHVLEPLSGYIGLAQALLGADARQFATSWNFGPDAEDNATVADVANAAARLWGNGANVETSTAAGQPHEAGLLRLDSSRARTMLDWRPRWNLEQALQHTVAWHQASNAGADARALCLEQIQSYELTPRRG